MVGPFFVFMLSKLGVPFGFAFVVAVVLAGVVCILMERLAYRPLRGAPAVTPLLTSLAVSIFLQNSTILVAGGETKAFQGPGFLDARLQLGQNVGFSSIALVIMAAAMILLVLFTL